MKSIFNFVVKSISSSIIFSAIFGAAILALLAVDKRITNREDTQAEADRVIARQRLQERQEKYDAQQAKEVARWEQIQKRWDDEFKRSDAQSRRYDAQLSRMEAFMKRDEAWLAQKEANVKRERAVLTERERRLGLSTGKTAADLN